MGGKGAKRKQRDNRNELTSLARESRRLVVQVQEVIRTCSCPAWQRHLHSCPENSTEEDPTQVSVLESIERRVQARQEPLLNLTQTIGKPIGQPVVVTGYQPYNLNGKQRSGHGPANGASSRNEDAGAGLPGSCGATATPAAAASSQQPAAAAASSTTTAACCNANGIYYSDL